MLWWSENTDMIQSFKKNNNNQMSLKYKLLKSVHSIKAF